jgi:hypothetical protein
MVLNIAVGYGGRLEITGAVTDSLTDSLKGKAEPQRGDRSLTPEAIGRYLHAAGLPIPISLSILAASFGSGVHAPAERAQRVLHRHSCVP